MIGPLDAVADGVQTAQRGDGFLEHAAPALCVSLLFEEIRKGRDDFDFVRAEEGGQVFLSRLKHHGQVVAHHDVRAEVSSCCDEIAK